MSDVTDSKGEAPRESGDVPDAKFFGLGAGAPESSNPGQGNTRAGKQGRFVYNMNHKKRGRFLIINNRNFHPRTKMKDRPGTDIDAANLYQKFKALGFDVQLEQNLTCEKMIQKMKQAAKEDHSDSDCFGCAILSHGDEGIIYGTDGYMNMETLVAPFKGPNCPSLAGKPKLFFIQACRGVELDHGVDVADATTDDGSSESIRRIPAEADFLFAYSTTPGYYSWRNQKKGSWFVQALVQVLEEHGDKEEIMWLMTRVNGLVAYEFQSNSADPAMHEKKQIPSIVSQLTKQVYFKSK